MGAVGQGVVGLVSWYSSTYNYGLRSGYCKGRFGKKCKSLLVPNECLNSARLLTSNVSVGKAQIKQVAVDTTHRIHSLDYILLKTAGVSEQTAKIVSGNGEKGGESCA